MQLMIETIKKNWLTIILALISAGFVADSFGLIKFSRELTQADKTLLIQELREDRNYYQQLYRECQKSMNEIQKDVSFLRNNMQILTAINNDIPVPIWLKSPDGKMIFVNAEYERVFLLPIGKSSKDYVGKSDFEIWDSATAIQYRNNDIKALRSYAPLYITELIPMQGTKPKPLRVVKYIQKKDGRVIGIGGVGIFVE